LSESVSGKDSGTEHESRQLMEATMQDHEQEASGQDESQNALGQGKQVSRREFLRLAAISGAAVGLGAGLGGLATACGGETTTTTAAASTTTSAGPATTATTASVSTTASTGASAGREIKVGFVAPLTGALATFGKADEYCLKRWQESVTNGLVCGDGQNHPVKIIMKDSQSDTNRGAQVAGDLILNDKVDVMMAASTPETTNPVADQCEAAGVPCYTIGAPWQAYYYGRGATDQTPFKWTYHHFWGLEDVINVYTALWAKLPNNKKVGVLYPNDADGAAFADPKTGFPAVLPGLGYTITDPGRYQNGSEDFTSLITAFKRDGCEIVSGVPIPPDFTNFWKQCMQQSYNPKIVTIAKGVDTPPDVEALGSAGNNFTIECQWSPKFPFVSSLTGETCQQIADGFEAWAGMQWGSYLLFYAAFEVVADALKRTKNVDDKEVVIGAISTTKMNTLMGPVDFTTEPKQGTMHPVKNVNRSPLVAGQWVKGTKYPYDLVVVDNTNAPEITVEAESKQLQY
jgi:branched-chain amino acid transport system substrate-binding protein